MLVPWLLVCAGELKTEQGHLTVRLARKAWLPGWGREAALKVCTRSCITDHPGLHGKVEPHTTDAQFWVWYSNQRIWL